MELNEYILTCLFCNSKSKLQAIPHRVNNKVCGMIFVCGKHAKEYLGKQIKVELFPKTEAQDEH